MTYRAKEPWISEDDLVLTKTLGERIEYVRTNLIDKSGATMTQAALQAAAGLAKGHHTVMHWEGDKRAPKGAAPAKIAALAIDSGYRPEVFSLRGAEALVVEKAVPRLRALEARAVGAVMTIQALLEALAANGIQVPLPQEAVEYLATGTPTIPGTP